MISLFFSTLERGENWGYLYRIQEKETEEKKKHSATRVCRQYVGNDVGELSAIESGEQKHGRIRKEIEKRKEVGDVGKDCDIACKCRGRRSSGSTAGKNHGPAGVAQELSGKKRTEKYHTLHSPLLQEHCPQCFDS